MTLNLRTRTLTEGETAPLARSTRSRARSLLRGTATTALAVVALMCAVVPTAYATSYELAYTVSTSGALTVTNCNGTKFPSNVKGFQMSSGNYPTVAQIDVSFSPSTCGIMDAGNYTLEGSYFGSISTPDGNYWLRFGTVGVDYGSTDWTADWYYIQAYRLGGLWYAGTQPIDGITSTPSPTATTYSQNPITFSGTYNNGQSGAYNQILFDVTNTTQGFEMAITKPTSMQSIIGASYSFDYNLPAVGNYTYQVRLWDSANATGTPWVAGTGFGLGTTTARTATSTNAFNDPTPTSCDTLDIGCYIKIAVGWAFFPSQDSVDQFQTLTLANSYPFQYAYDIGNVRNELLTASATSTLTITVPFGTFGNITLLSAGLIQAVPFVGLLRTIIGYLLWFLFAELVYYQILRSHNKEV